MRGQPTGRRSANSSITLRGFAGDLSTEDLGAEPDIEALGHLAASRPDELQRTRGALTRG